MPRKSPRTTRARAARKSALQALTALRKLAVDTSQQARDTVVARASEARASTGEAVSRLQRVFEDRVTGVVARLGVPTSRDVRALSRQVAQLQQSVDQLRRVRAR